MTPYLLLLRLVYCYLLEDGKVSLLEMHRVARGFCVAHGGRDAAVAGTNALQMLQ